MKNFFREHNRAITLVSVSAILLHLSGRTDIAKGVLIGGLLPIVYVELLRRQLATAVSSGSIPGARGKIFFFFLTRYGLLATGLSLAYWVSWNSFFAAVIVLILMYGAQIVMLSRVAFGSSHTGKSSGMKSQDLTLNAQDEDGRVD